MLTLPRLWTPPPRRRIVRPSIPAHWRRGPHHQRHCPLYTMADGDESMDANGDQIVDANGDEYVKCCCDDTTTPVYAQARTCACPNTDVDLWVGDPVGTLNFTKGSTAYYVDATNNRSTTPGTLLTAPYVITANCPSIGTCVGRRPCTIRVAFTGIATRSGCVGNVFDSGSTAARYDLGGLDFNGVYDCPFDGTQWSLRVPVSVTRYANNGCTGATTAFSAEILAYASFTSGTPSKTNIGLELVASGGGFGSLLYAYITDTTAGTTTNFTCNPYGTQSSNNQFTSTLSSFYQCAGGGSATAVEP